ncbi:MAG TPA: tetratricopeptide repeat protein [Polyangiaceae bacterium]|nr:tetratricopeptide repeat protein [Polyangiaceae bacterium]
MSIETTRQTDVRRAAHEASSARARRTSVGCLGLLLTALGCASATPPEPASPATLQHERAEMARSLLETGRALAAQGDALRAEQYLRAALAGGAPADDVMPALVSVCIASQRYRAAISDARDYLQLHPNATRLRFVLASLLAGLGDFPAAVDELTQLVTQQPNHVLGHYALGVLYRDRLRHAERADHEFRAYLQLAPSGSHAEEARASLLQHVQVVD